MLSSCIGANVALPILIQTPEFWLEAKSFSDIFITLTGGELQMLFFPTEDSNGKWPPLSWQLWLRLLTREARFSRWPRLLLPSEFGACFFVWLLEERLLNTAPDLAIPSPSSLIAVPPSAPVCRIQGSLNIGSDITLTCNSEEGIPRPTYYWERQDSTPKLPPTATQGDCCIPSIPSLPPPRSGNFIFALLTRRTGSSSMVGYPLCMQKSPRINFLETLVKEY